MKRLTNKEMRLQHAAMFAALKQAIPALNTDVDLSDAEVMGTSLGLIQRRLALRACEAAVGGSEGLGVLSRDMPPTAEDIVIVPHADGQTWFVRSRNFGWWLRADMRWQHYEPTDPCDCGQWPTRDQAIAVLRLAAGLARVTASPVPEAVMLAALAMLA
jgi:hypothetical protein